MPVNAVINAEIKITASYCNGCKITKTPHDVRRYPVQSDNKDSSPYSVSTFAVIYAHLYCSFTVLVSID